MLVLAGALAMIVLAGDPHTAVNVVLFCFGALLVSSVRARDFKRFTRMACWLTAAVGIAVGLSAVQWVPTLQWSMRSHRLLGDNQDMPVQVPASESQVGEDQVPELLQQILSEQSHRPCECDLRIQLIALAFVDDAVANCGRRLFGWELADICLLASRRTDVDSELVFWHCASIVAFSKTRSEFCERA